MRLEARQCQESSFHKEVLSNAEELYLTINTDDFPYIIPLNFVHLGNAIYIHCALEGTKLDLIAKDSRVGFCAAIDVQIIREKFTTYYKSVCGTGHASMVTDNKEKLLALDALGRRYNAMCPRPAPGSTLDRVAIVRIDIVQMTGKRNQAKQP